MLTKRQIISLLVIYVYVIMQTKIIPFKTELFCNDVESET